MAHFSRIGAGKTVNVTSPRKDTEPTRCRAKDRSLSHAGLLAEREARGSAVLETTGRFVKR